MRKPAFCICKNKDAIPLLPNFKIDSSHLLWLCSAVCVGPGRKPRRPVFSQRGSFDLFLVNCAIEKEFIISMRCWYYPVYKKSV